MKKTKTPAVAVVVTPAVVIKKETKTSEIATNGKRYVVDPKTKKAKAVKTFNSLKELATIDAAIKKSDETNLVVYIKFLREQGVEVSNRKNYFIANGFKFTFGDEGLTVKDNLQFGREIDFIHPPTPKDIFDFLKAEPAKRIFTPEENTKAAALGKKLLEEKKEIAVAELPKVLSTDDLMKQKAKAMRLIKRIETKQTDSKKLFDELPFIVEFRRLKINLTLAIKKYRSGKLRFPKLLVAIKDIFEKEDFVAAPEKAPKFVGVEFYNWNEVVEKDEKTVTVDGKIFVNKGKFLIKYLLRTDKHPQLMPQIMKYCAGKIHANVLHGMPWEKDAFVEYNENLLNDLSREQIAAIELLFYKIEEHNPLQFLYKSELKKGDNIRAFFDASATTYEGKVIDLKQGTLIRWEDGSVEPLFKSSRYILNNKK